jgi:enediyne biosynthesis protein E4
MPSKRKFNMTNTLSFATFGLLALAVGTLAAQGELQVKGNHPNAPASAVHFEDITRAAGIRFAHNNGAIGKKWLPETMGPGVALIDYDNDGWQDILLVNGMDWPGHARKHTTLALYHNNQNGTFTDVTQRAGLAVEMFGMGVAIGDYDNDGRDDIFITTLGQSHLFHNNGNGTFTDVT